MTRENIKIKLLEIMKARYFEKDHLCLKSFINDIDHFVIAELEAQNKALTDMVEMQSEKISGLEAPKSCKSCLFYVTRYNIHGDEAYKYCTAEINKASDAFLCNKYKEKHNG